MPFYPLPKPWLESSLLMGGCYIYTFHWGCQRSRSSQLSGMLQYMYLILGFVIHCLFPPQIFHRVHFLLANLAKIHLQNSQFVYNLLTIPGNYGMLYVTQASNQCITQLCREHLYDCLLFGRGEVYPFP